ncbi:hypothetical protein AAZX31_07G033400 [Glycine max]
MEQKQQSIDPFKGKTRLPSFAIPERYELHLIPDLSACTFSVTVQISLTINASTEFLVLNALELVIQNTHFTNSQGQHIPHDVVVDNDDEILVLVFHEFSGILNEHPRGFYKCYMATDILFPEWNTWNKFLLVEIHHARSVIEIFYAVSYKKGSAVIRMLQGYLGDKSLSTYMRRYPAQNAKTEDLWNVLSQVSGVLFNIMMNTWTRKAGYPVIHSQFLLSGQHGKWVVPITLSIGSYERQKKFLLETSQGRVDISLINICELIQSIGDDLNSNEKKYEVNSQENIWVKVNDDQRGFYRVNYEGKLAQACFSTGTLFLLILKGSDSILDDGNALCQACEQSLSSLLMLKDVYRKEIDYVIVSKLIDVCYDVLKITTDAIPDSVNELKQYFISLLMCSAEQLGWDSISGEDHSISLLRGEVFQALATFDHAKTQQDALCRFQILLDGRNTSLLPANIRRVAYIAVMRNTTTENRTGLESLLSFYRSCIASSADPNVVIEVLNLLLSDAIPDQDIIYVLAGISNEGILSCSCSCSFITNIPYLELWEIYNSNKYDNWERILARYGAGLLLTNFISQMFPLVNSDEKADEIEEFFASHMNHSIIMNLKLSIEQI